MNNSLRMCSVQRVGNLDAQVKNFFDRQRFAIDVPPQCLAINELHCQERPGVLLADVMDGADVGVV